MRIAILISGQMRGSPFSNTNEGSQDILESWTRSLFTLEFKENNEYSVFVATDAINQDSLEEYFGKDRIGGMEVCDGSGIDGIDKWGPAYLTRPHKHPTAWVGYRPIWQWYRLYRAWLLMKNSGINYDCVIRLRPDTIIHSSCQNTLKRFCDGGDGEAQLYMAWDIFAIGCPAIMEAYCGLIKTVGSYVPQPDTYSFSHNGMWSKKTHRELIADAGYLFSPEMQLIELLMEWVLLNGCGRTIDQTLANADISVSLDKKDFSNINRYRNAGN